MEEKKKRHEKIKLVEINSYITCKLCKGYIIDATTISECLHSFCRSCIIKFLQDNSHCPTCEVMINKAKPNIKLDKTLQDIVYKLVPELFAKEMTRRRRFYQNHPEAAAKATPEERGVDTERTIYNPNDHISLSIEYIRDDSTPGAIVVPSTPADGINCGKNGPNVTPSCEQEGCLKRFLQCPGMCRVDVLKKFVRNKYNVDTNLFYIDILYKRVPLPDHYTLIDIAYIYSWKRNEPMKFFFKITDINKATDRFDFVEPTVIPEVVNRPVRVAKAPNKKSEKRDKIRTSQVNSKKIKNDIIKSDKNRIIVKNCKDDESIEKEITEEIKSRIQNDPTNDKTSIYTNITLNRSNNIEIITKIQKVSNRNGQPIGLNIIKQTVKKSKPLPLPTLTPPVATSAQNSHLQVKNEDNHTENVSVQIDVKQEKIVKGGESNGKSDNKVLLTPIKSDTNQNKTELVENKIETRENTLQHKKEAREAKKEPIETKKEPPNSEVKVKEEPVSLAVKTEPVEDEIEKSIFLKSIELTARSSLPERKITCPEKKPALTSKLLLPDIKYKPTETKPSSSQKVPNKPISSQKRKNSSPVKNPQPAKKPRVPKKPKNIQNPMVKQMVTNVNQGASNLNRIVEQNSPKATTQKELQSLFDSCKINIPSSLSITLKESSDDDASRRTPNTIKPVQNFIEILKISENGNVQESTPTKLVKMEQQTTVTPLPKSSSDKCLTPECQVKTEENQPQNFKTTTPLSSPKPVLSPSSTKTPQPLLTTPAPLKTPPTPTSQNKPTLNLPSQLKHMAKENLVKLNPRSAQTFQKMFEEAIKKPDYSTKLPALPKKDTKDANASVVASKVQKNVLDLSVGENGGNKRNILEIASQLQKKTKLSHDLVVEKQGVDNAEYPKPPPGKVAIPRLNNQRPPTKAPSHTPSKQIKTDNKSPVTSVDLHSSRLGINYTVSVGGSSISPGQKEPKTVQASSISPQQSFSFKSEAQSFSKELPSPKTTKPEHFSPKESISTALAPLQEEIRLPKPSAFSPKLPLTSPKVTSPKLPSPSSTSKTSIKIDPLRLQTPPTSTISSSKPSPKQNKSPCRVPNPKAGGLSPNQILEKYNIQNLAQLTASFNFNAANFVMNPANQLAALQQAMILKHFEMQNRQNWLNMNPSPLVQYEKYLQSLTQGQNHLLGNIKEN